MQQPVLEQPRQPAQRLPPLRLPRLLRHLLLHRFRLLNLLLPLLLKQKNLSSLKTTLTSTRLR